MGWDRGGGSEVALGEERTLSWRVAAAGLAAFAGLAAAGLC